VPQDKPLTITPTIKIKKTATGTPSHTTFFHKSLYVMAHWQRTLYTPSLMKQSGPAKQLTLQPRG
jgi:hypothetical protein